MNKLNHPLPQLPAWKPRPPAAGLKERIFAVRPSAPEEKSRWHLLVPAMACLLVSLLVLNSNNSLAPARLNPNRLGNLCLSNLSCSAYAIGGTQDRQNHLDSVTIDWTNHSGLPFPMSFKSSTN